MFHISLLIYQKSRNYRCYLKYSLRFLFLYYPRFSHTSVFSISFLFINGALVSDLISSEFTSLHKSAQLIRISFQIGFVIWIARFLEYSPPSDITLSKSIGLRVCQVILFACWFTLLNQDIFKALVKEYICGILNLPDDKFLIASFLVIQSGPAYPYKFEKKIFNILISSAGRFGNDRNSDANFDNASDFMMVMRPKRVSFDN